ncbi:MAG: serine/threonine-protein kinase, partial [Acidobacteria bacterium]|nr:serine/threonine-protein kinase [Acidobacteriota bacterium]
SSGTRIGSFEIVDLLGAGGMGAVYRAYDPRLRRQVAIKVLPPTVAGDADRLQRFEREALAVARLAHPNILAIHDIGTHEGSPYLVTELLEGETLRQKMAGQPLSIRRAVEYASQIARGLAAAHEHGIVHRDIKPDNLFITRDGRLKILDFGLAKLTDADAVTDADAATLTVRGLGVLGTASYMSPEQARGAGADHRADLFSLGVVLYEMLSGVSPFRRGSSAETMTAVIREEVPEFSSPSVCPPPLNRILRHCLEKNPAERFQTARDLVFDLEALSDPASVPVRPAGRRFSNRYLRALFTVCALALIAGAGFMVGQRTAAPAQRPGITGIYRLTDFSGIEEFPAIAPDSKAVAFTARVDGSRQIFVRLLAGGTALQVTKEAVDHEMPRWSRDASAIVYFSPAAPGGRHGTIWEVPALGGAPRRIIDSTGGGDIGRDGRVACFRVADGQIELVTASTDGADVAVVTRFSEPVYYTFPRWSPDAKWIAYQRGDGVRWDIFVVPAGGGPPRQLTRENRQIHGLAWLPDSSRIVYSSSRGSTMSYLPTLSLWEADLDGSEPRLVAPGEPSYVHPDIHESGTMVASRLQMQFDLWRYPTDAAPEDNVRRALRLTRQTGQIQTPTVGSSDREIAFLSDSGGHANLWVLTLGQGELRQITHERDRSVALGVPVWSPDGKRIAFVSSRGNTGLGFGVWTVAPDGGNLRNLAANGLGMAWSEDGQWVYYTDAGVVYKVPETGGPAVRVRSGPVRNVAGIAGNTLYFIVDGTLADGSPGFEVHAATPEDAPSRLLSRIPASRAPQWQIVNPSLSPNGTSLAMPLTDGVTTNIWTLSAATGGWRQITDFGERPIFIARRVSWSADGRSILAAVGEGDADIVMFETTASSR